MVDISRLKTESRNPKTMELDRMSAADILKVMNEEDGNTVRAVQKALPEIAKAVEACIQALNRGGRMIYIGAGTSGRMGVMDAVECTPTFSTTNEVIACMAGGSGAFVKAREGAEDQPDLGRADLVAVKLSAKDIVIGIAASGRTPYVIGALDYARETGAASVSVACNQPAEMSSHAQIAIECNAGPEVLTGSTRLKAGTCQKMILNMLSTATMIGIGKVYGNLMVDMKPTNEKLEERAVRIVMEAAGCERSEAVEVLQKSQYRCKTAIVMVLLHIGCQEAEARLQAADGFVRRALAG